MLLLLALTLLPCALLLGWGPGHHLEFAERVLRRRRELLPSDVSKLLGEERQAYLYGCIAADIINFKAYGGAYNHCHRWTILDAMREIARTPRQEAFILGYLSHLAADTIAHNHFVPYHLVRYARGRGLGHLYWELNADRFVPEERWNLIAPLKGEDDLVQLDELVNATVPTKALSMRTNKLIFNHVLLVSEKRQWRTMMARIHPMRQVRLEKGFLTLFQRAAVERVRLALRPKGLRALEPVDPNGKLAQRTAVAERVEILARTSPGAVRREACEKAAAPFLEGMESPPRG